MRTRKIEMYVGLKDGKYITTKVLIPLATPPDLIERIAIACCKQLLVQMHVAHLFVGVLDIPEPDGIEWRLWVNEYKGGLPMCCIDVEDCLQHAITFFKCTDEQLGQLRNGAVVAVNVENVGETTLRIGHTD